ncbi:unnamed protein product [Brassica rapa]|uniref:Golgin-84 n=1 Tax=Brassica campestris TaxID=3711 RepID=A0A3P6BYJ5_BRACM|nr:unnamed protein product [Brassica rapa]VDD07298.1 unnamed protein product [Brassica rapa]
MANWISSKLKAAETILQQIDQQAAESLRKDEKPETTYDEAFETFSKSASLVSLKDQLRKKTNEGSSSSCDGSQRNSLELKPSGKTLRRSDQAQERATSKTRLEGEKQSLEKIVVERAKQQAQEASELQTNMMETLDAADLEKQKHNNTRMEVFSHLAGLEATNTELTRSLAAGQKKLQTQIDQVTLLREQVEVKESVLEVMKGKTSNIRGSGNFLNKLDASRGDIFEHQMLEAEISLLTDKIGRLQDKANKLEADISTMKKELEEPTEVETELRRRLDQLTDHLIQKQSQVEALSSDKATLSFRIEAVTRLIEENKGMSATEASSQDLEAGEWKLSGSKLKPAFQSKIRSGKKHLGWLVMQLNAIFVSGTVFLRRNPTAKIWALVYLVCLHLWVLYILLSHSNVSSSNELKSGAVISLENSSLQ